VALALTFALAPGLGLLGPAIAVIAGQWVVAEAQVHRTAKLFGVRWTDLFPWGDLVRMTALALALGAALHLARQAVAAPPLAVLAAGTLLYFAAFYAAATLVGLIRRAELVDAIGLLRQLGGRR
jgi:hypothetical protein